MHLNAVPVMSQGSAYVLLHHVMGEAAGRKGVWSYVEGGMGMVSHCIARAAQDAGAEIATNATVHSIVYDKPKGGMEGACNRSTVSF